MKTIGGERLTCWTPSRKSSLSRSLKLTPLLLIKVPTIEEEGEEQSKVNRLKPSQKRNPGAFSRSLLRSPRRSLTFIADAIRTR